MLNLVLGIAALGYAAGVLTRVILLPEPSGHSRISRWLADPSPSSGQSSGYSHTCPGCSTLLRSMPSPRAREASCTPRTDRGLQRDLVHPAPVALAFAAFRPAELHAPGPAGRRGQAARTGRRGRHLRGPRRLPGGQGSSRTSMSRTSDVSVDSMATCSKGPSAQDSDDRIEEHLGAGRVGSTRPGSSRAWQAPALFNVAGRPSETSTSLACAIRQATGRSKVRIRPSTAPGPGRTACCRTPPRVTSSARQLSSRASSR